MNLGLEGRTALALGASSGLGLASAESLCEEGANVVMFARRKSQSGGASCMSARASDMWRRA
jgi:NAD(P)-dependent dehydrogenase (short-subunit alcohol dehydrogenase family)